MGSSQTASADGQLRPQAGAAGEGGRSVAAPASETAAGPAAAASSAHGDGWRRRVLLAIVVVAALLRLCAVFDDLWMDEVWSVGLAEQAPSAPAIFTQIHDDNNHKLNTLWLYLVGSQPAQRLYVYRLLSLLSGIGSVALMAVIAGRWGSRAQLLATALGGCSYLLVQYSTEARGYGSAVFFSLLAFWLLERFLRAGDGGRNGWPWAAGFGGAVVLGFLSHLTFMYPYAGLACWSCWALLGPKRRSWGRGWLDLARLHAVPLAFLVLLYLLDLRYAQVGGGPELALTEVLAELGQRMFALPAGGVLALGVLLLALGVCARETVRLWRDGSALAAFFPAALLVAPALVLTCTGWQFIYARYFLVCVPFVYLLVASALARLWDRPGNGPAACAALTGLLLLGQLWGTAQLILIGRGQYLRAMVCMAEHTPGPVVVVGGDHDFQNGMLVAFYQRYVPSKRWLYVPRESWAARPPEWIIALSTTDDLEVLPDFRTREGAAYRLEQVYARWGSSGFHWVLYHRVGLRMRE